MTPKSGDNCGEVMRAVGLYTLRCVYEAPNIFPIS